MVSNSPEVVRSPPSTEHPLFRMAMKFAKEAVALDQARRHAEAISKYTLACRALVEFLGGVNKNPKLHQLCCEKVLEYVARAKYLASKVTPPPSSGGSGKPVARVTRVFAPPKSCEGCRFYDRYRDDCRSVRFHLTREHRDEDLACPGKEPGTPPYCPGGEC